MKNNTNIESESETYLIPYQDNIKISKNKKNYPKNEHISEEELIYRLSKRNDLMKMMTPINKCVIKLYKNIYFYPSILLLIVVYWIYMMTYIQVLIEASENGGDYRFWMYLEDSYYRRGFINFLIVHTLLIMCIYSFLVLLMIDPGVIDKDYLNYFSLISHLDPNTAKSLQQKNLFIYLKQEYYSKKTDIPYEDDFLSHKQQISNDSFQALFVNEICFAENPNSININEALPPINDKVIEVDKDFYNKRQFFFKFMYYTENINIDDIKHNKRYCVFCKIIRPQRTHHCIKCRKCVLKMDHHCLFLDFCIGLRNYKPFIIFLFYLNAFFFFIFVTMTDGIVLYFKNKHQTVDFLIISFFLIGFILAGIAMVSVIELLIGHLYFIALGNTTREDNTKSNAELIVELNEKGDKNSYENYVDVFGGNIFMWLLPISLTLPIYEGYLWFKKDKSYLEYVIMKRNNFIMDWNKELNQSINRNEEDENDKMILENDNNLFN